MYIVNLTATRLDLKTILLIVTLVHIEHRHIYYVYDFLYSGVECVCGVRPHLHESGTKSIRDDLVSDIVLFIIDVYMRLG